MASDSTGRRDRRIVGDGSIEHELTMHLEKAHELAERAKRSNGLLLEQLERACEIAAELRGVACDK
jgi:hypothetical protein